MMNRLPVTRLRRPLPVLAGLLLLGSLAGCGLTREEKKISVYQREGFENNETYARLFDGNVGATCEAARRALLSQGYLIGLVKSDFVSGTKSFQPEGEVHIQIAFNVVCVPEGRSGKIATAFVNAIQDRYALKKNQNSASVGLSAIGSVSIPLGATEDSLVKVASETIPAGPFYDRFFTLMQRYLETPGDEVAERAEARPAELPPASPPRLPAGAAPAVAIVAPTSVAQAAAAASAASAASSASR